MKIPTRSIEFTHEQTNDSSTPELESEKGVRVDSGVSTGSVVSTFYDPMIAKLIAYGETREDAIAKLERSLRNFQVYCEYLFSFLASTFLLTFFLRLLGYLIILIF